jgi:hypothetical protein
VQGAQSVVLPIFIIQRIDTSQTKKVKGDIAYMYWNWIEVETKRKKTLSFPEATETNH